MGLGREDILRTDLRQYLTSLRIKRRSQYLHDTLLAILLNKDKDEDLIEAIEKSSCSSTTKEELIDWLHRSGTNKGDYK